MNTRTTLILLAVLVLVAGVVYFTEFYKPGQATVTPAASGPTMLLEVTSPAIGGITVRDALSGTQVSASRDVSGTWWLADPAGRPADPAILNPMATRLSSIYVQRVLTPTGSLGEFGLLTPTLSVEIASTLGPLSFVVGDTTPSQGAYYVQKPGDPRVYLVDAGLVSELRKFAGQPPLAAPPTPAPFALPTPAMPALSVLPTPTP
jgi:hypothetical protein